MFEKTTKYASVAVSHFGNERLNVLAKEWEEDWIKQKLVLLTQSEGSMRFQFSMTPEQAREMAMALVAAADSLA